MNKEVKDTAIIGAGPAGLTAALYTCRYNLDILIFGKEPGGMGVYAPLVENYPGVIGLSGIELMKRFQKQVEKQGVEIIEKEIVDIKLEQNYFALKSKEDEFKAKTIVLATGSKKRKLQVKGEKEFVSKGVHYCAVCDAALYQNKKVMVVGGGDSAFRAAEMLLSQDNEVYLIDIAKKFFATPHLIKEVKKNKKAHLIQKNSITEIRGEKAVEKVILGKPYQGEKELAVEGIFVEIGMAPRNKLAKKLGLALNKKGEIIVDDLNQTDMRGVFAAGDITNIMGTKQIVTAAAQGAVAATSVYKYLTAKNK